MDKFPALSNQEAFILSYLTHNERSYGPDMVTVSSGLLTPGTVYDILEQMIEKGYVSSWEEETEEDGSEPPKMIYKSTREGAAIYNVWRRMVMKIALQPFQK